MPIPARHLLLLLFVGALGAAFWRAPTPAETSFTPPLAAVPSTLPALFVSEMLWRDAESAATPSLTELPDGRIAATWLAGPADALSVRFSIRNRDGWSRPVIVATQASTAGGTFAQVGTLGKPVLYAEGSWLHLWYGSNTVGSSINHSVSTDGSKTWTKPARLQTSPFANFGDAVRTPPVPLADGGLCLPISHDFIGRGAAWLRLSSTGQILDKIRLPGTGQATVADCNEQRANEPLAMINPNATAALLRLKSGRLLLAGNPPGGRQAILLWLSADQGKTWQESRTVESAPDGGADFGNPSLLLGHDGRIHLAYDWRQQGIKHVVFSEAWLDGGQP
jgi:predicted neuraminidase